MRLSYLFILYQEFVEYIYSEATTTLTTHFDAKITPRGIETPLGVSNIVLKF